MAEGNTHSAATIDQNLFDQTNVDTMEWFDDIFDIMNENDDNDNEELEKIMEEYNQDFDFDYLDTNVDEEEMTTMEEDNNKKVEEQIPSQQFSQLSTKDENDQEVENNKKRLLSTPSTPDAVVSKKIRILDDNSNHQKEQMPNYLKTTSNIFDHIMTNYVINNVSSMTITIEDIRQLAILKHKIAVINIEKQLWTVYLKSGTGQWKTQESSIMNANNRRVWPMEVKKLLSCKLETINSNQTTNDEQEMYESLVHEHLEESNRIIQKYQNEFNEKKQCLFGFTDELEKAIQTLVQYHGIRPLEMELNYKIAMLEYDYDAELLEREYLQLKPTKYQTEVARRLYDLRYKHLQAKQELIELKQRILCDKPTELMINSILLSISGTSITEDSMMDYKLFQRLFDQQEKEKQEKLTDMMARSIDETENKIHNCRGSFNQEILQVSVIDDNKTEGLTGNLVNIVYRRFNIIQKKIDYISNFRMNYYLRSHYGDSEDAIDQITIGFSPTMIIDTPLHELTDEQMKLLNRGPSYIPPCQMYVSSSYISMNDMIQKQYKLLQQHLSTVFTNHDINTAQSMFINKEIKQAYTNTFSISLPLSIQQRGLYEKQLVQSIQEHLKVNDLILRRTADQKNVFYLGNRKDFEEKANEYMMKTDTFEVHEFINDNDLQQTQKYLTKMIESMNSEFKKIFNNTKFYKELLKYLYIDVTKIQLPYLYFLPDVSKKNTLSVKPIIVSQSSATSRLGHFLDGLIRPVIERYTESTTFINEADFIRKLNQYTNEEHHLHSRTIFTTMKILNYYTVVSHADMLIVLKDFLGDHLAYPGTEHISIQKIISLTTLFLNNNRFYYNNKIYRFTKGSPNSLLLTETLALIYAFQWQKVLLREPLMQRELYGRCKNEIIFTWNETVTKFRQLLQTLGSEYPNVQLEVKMGFKCQFLNAHIENQNGTLYSCVYRDPNSQKYTLPYVIGDAKVAHSHWLRSALIRAVRYCTSVEDFNHERIYLEMTCLANGYSLEFVEHRINHFFTHFDATSLRLFLDQNVYKKLRRRLFNFISEQNQFISKEQELEKNNRLVRLSYLYQLGPKHQFNKQLQEILSKYLYTPPPTASTNNKIKIILTTKQQYSLNALLSQQKPSHPLLNKEKTIF